jgi:2-polyprenyl-6-methoxyphenol hydroxylase-like FAD-dependent oxidoreductase
VGPSGSNREVLIVGAGPVGLTLANDLALRGIPIRIIDRLPEANPHAKAHGLQSRTLEALDVIGLGAPMIHNAVQPQPTLMTWQAGRPISETPAGGPPRQPYPYQLGIWQQTVEKVLTESLADRGHKIQRSCRLIDFSMDDDGVDARAEQDGEQVRLRAGWVVGCDGGRSAVRSSLGLEMHGDTEPGKWFIGEFDIDWNMSRDVIFLSRHRKGSAIAFFDPLNQRWHTWVTLPDENLPLTLENVNAVWREYTGLDSEISNPLWMHELRVNYGTADRYRDRRALLAGDAAHVHSSAGGQGLNTGVQDALNLGWKLALTIDRQAAPGLLDTYNEERLAQARNVLALSKRMHKVMYPRDLRSRAISRAVAMAMRRPALAERLAARQMSMLHIHCQDSSLSEHGSDQAPTGTRAGTFVPDVSCRHEGQATTLFAALRGPTAELLLCAGDSPSAATKSRLTDQADRLRMMGDRLRVHLVFQSDADMRDSGWEAGETGVIIDGGRNLRRVLGIARPEIMYVRPDGYIGYRGTDLDPDPLDRYLKRVYASDVVDALPVLGQV